MCGECDPNAGRGDSTPVHLSLSLCPLLHRRGQVILPQLSLPRFCLCACLGEPLPPPPPHSPRRSAACFVAALPASGRAHPRGRQRRAAPPPVIHSGAGARRCRRLVLPDPSPCFAAGARSITAPRAPAGGIRPGDARRPLAADVPESPVCRRLHARNELRHLPGVNQRLDAKRTFAIKEKFFTEAEENLDAFHF